MAYDQGYWHTDQCSELGVEESFAGTHIAIYIKWCLERGLLNDEFDSEDGEARENVKSGRMSANEYFENHLDWKFGKWNLNPRGNEFTESYYNNYIEDLNKSFPAIIYGDEDKVNFAALCYFLDKRYEEFEQIDSAALSTNKKQWWKLW